MNIEKLLAKAKKPYRAHYQALARPEAHDVGPGLHRTGSHR